MTTEALYLEPITKPRKSRKVAVYDIETTTDLTKVYLVGFFDGVTYRYWESTPMLPEKPGSAVDQFMTWLLYDSGQKYTHDRNHYWLYAHNGGNFDVLYLVKWLLSRPIREHTVMATPVQSSVLCLEVRAKGQHKRRARRWQFLDSWRLMNASLDKLGQAYGLGGKVEGIDYENLMNDPRRYEYLERDCRLLHACLLKFYGMVENAGGEIGMTVAATAMLTWRRKHLSRTIARNKHFKGCDDEACQGCLHSFVREAYYGGRTEVFIRQFEGPGVVRLYDFNAMYAAAMLSVVPVDYAMERRGWVDIDWPLLGFLECTVDLPRTHIPPLPFRHEGKLVFPCGRLRGVWSSIELQRALKCGGQIVEYGRSVWFRGAPVFRDYVIDWYQWRHKDTPGYTEAMDSCAKMMLTNLYGKTGMSEQREKIWFDPSAEDFEAHEFIPLSADPSMGFLEPVRVTAPYIVPHLAAWITALARCQLWDTMQTALTRGGRVWYCDTDSLVTDVELPVSNELGALKLETTATRAHFAAPKLYYLETPGADRVKMKGFGGGFGAGKLTKELYESVVHRNGSQVTNRMLKLRQGIRDAKRFPSMLRQEKRLNSTVDKRTFGHNGESIPLVLQ